MHVEKGKQCYLNQKDKPKKKKKSIKKGKKNYGY